MCCPMYNGACSTVYCMRRLWLGFASSRLSRARFARRDFSFVREVDFAFVEHKAKKCERGERKSAGRNKLRSAAVLNFELRGFYEPLCKQMHCNGMNKQLLLFVGWSMNDSAELLCKNERRQRKWSRQCDKRRERKKERI